MRKYWYQKILIMIVVFTVSVGGSYALIRRQQNQLKQEVSAEAETERMVIPGGMPVGIYLKTDGVMVLGTQKITDMNGIECEPAAHLVKSGDYIVGINGQKIEKKSELIEAVEDLDKGEVILQVVRNDEELDIKMKCIRCSVSEYKLGIWVKDNAQGLGTITYLDADSNFGALGHGIHDVDTNELLDISEGKLYLTSIKDVQKGENGTPGGMEGIIVYNNYNVVGSIKENTNAGIFGTIDRIDAIFADQTPIRTAAKEEIEEGPAVIRCAVEGKVKEYDVEITKVDLWTDEVNKGITVEVTDPELLEAAGGIIQGM